MTLGPTLNTMTLRNLNFSTQDDGRPLFNLARAACMPRGLYVLLALIFFLYKLLSKENLESTGPIFTKFSSLVGRPI